MAQLIDQPLDFANDPRWRIQLDPNLAKVLLTEVNRELGTVLL